MDFGDVCSMHMGTFDLKHAKVILGSFGVLSQSLTYLENGPHRVKRTKVWALRVNVENICRMGTFDLEQVNVILGVITLHELGVTRKWLTVE